MDEYLRETAYAVRGLFELMGVEDARLIELQNEMREAESAYKQAESILYFGPPESAFGEDTTSHFQHISRTARAQMQAARQSIEAITAAHEAKAFSLAALAGAVLQVARQGIVTTHSTLANCPNGRVVAGLPLKSVVWEARNQAMHWAEGELRPPVKSCFSSLHDAFGPQFALSPRSLAREVLTALCWLTYEDYERDMQSLA